MQPAREKGTAKSGAQQTFPARFAIISQTDSFTDYKVYSQKSVHAAGMKLKKS